MQDCNVTASAVQGCLNTYIAYIGCVSI